MSGIEVKVMCPTKSHHNAIRIGDDDECLLNFMLDVRRGGTLLLEDSLLRLLRSRSYALVGNNGVGKSTLLDAISNGGEIAAVARHVTHLVGQFEDNEMKSGNAGCALNLVLANDVQLNRVRNRLESCPEEELASCVSEEELLEESAKERATKALRRLGFESRIMRERTAVEHLSAGWRMRARLAVALNAGAEILLLDEPTTSLDASGIGMLVESIRCLYQEMCFVIVSHNRTFLERTCSDVLLLQEKKLVHYPMSFEAFWSVTAQKIPRKQKQFDKQEAMVENLKRQVASLQSSAAKGHSNVAGAIGARKKKLEQIESGTCNKHENGKRYHRFSNKTFFYQYGPNVSGSLRPPVLVRPPRWTLAPPRSSSFGCDDILLALSDAKIGYANADALLSFCSLAIRPGMKILVKGKNGGGKSSLLRTLAGELSLLSGTRFLHHHVRLGYFSQLSGEQFSSVTKSPLEFMMESCGLREVDARAKLHQFGISGDVSVLRMADLSGGQKVRFAFAKLSADEPHILLLDEPETHLDLLTNAQLAECLSNWNDGAVVLVTHDDDLAVVCNETIQVGDEG